MPDRYDRAVCVSELNMRNDIVSKITTDGWRPKGAFNTTVTQTGPNVNNSQITASQASDPPENEQEVKGESLLPSEVASTTSEEEVGISDLYN